MPISITGREGGITLTLSGEIDHHGARTMMRELDQAISTLLPRRLTLCLSGVTFMDSSGIAVALRGWQRMQELGGTVTLRHVAQQPRKVLEAAGIGRMMTIE